jgi:hypothetical protein
MYTCTVYNEYITNIKLVFFLSILSLFFVGFFKRLIIILLLYHLSRSWFSPCLCPLLSFVSRLTNYVKVLRTLT